MLFHGEKGSNSNQASATLVSRTKQALTDNDVPKQLYITLSVEIMIYGEMHYETKLYLSQCCAAI